MSRSLLHFLFSPITKQLKCKAENSRPSPTIVALTFCHSIRFTWCIRAQLIMKNIGRSGTRVESLLSIWAILSVLGLTDLSFRMRKKPMCVHDWRVITSLYENRPDESVQKANHTKVKGGKKEPDTYALVSKSNLDSVSIQVEIGDVNQTGKIHVDL